MKMIVQGLLSHRDPKLQQQNRVMKIKNESGSMSTMHHEYDKITQYSC